MRGAARLLAACLLTTAGSAWAGATILITSADGPDAGFNDPTPATPIAGNPGTTLGAQRLAVFQEAARIWGQALDSAVPIHVLANFQSLTCDSESGVLGRAYSPNIFASDDPTFTAGPPTVFPRAHTWYVAAESERFAGKAVLSGTGTAVDNYQIVANFNSALDTPPCLGGVGWYYGFDTNHGEQFDLLTVVLHEFGHGLGFTSQDDPTTGEHTSGEPDIWDYFLYDITTGKHWIDLTDSGRLASVTSNALAWDGPAVKAAVPGRLDAALALRVNASTPQNFTNLAGAQFGGTVGTTALVGPIGVAGPNNYGCSGSGSLGNLAGSIAVVDRGPPDAGCTFVEKARNAQDAGAVAVLFANYTTGLLSPGGEATDVTIPAFGITQNDGTALKGLAGTPASLLRDPSLGFAGADSSARGLMYAPNPFNAGSSVVHWDTSATPDLLMEYAINSDLKNDLDLTVPLLHDIGWNLVDVKVTGSGPTTLASGAQGTYTFVVTNPGPSVAPAVTATNAVSGMSFVSNAGDCSGSYPCNLGDLASGETRTITSVFQAAAGNNLTTSVTVASSANYNPTNDTALVTINALAVPDAGTGGGGGSTSGCGAAPGRPMAGLAGLTVLGLLALRPRRRA